MSNHYTKEIAFILWPLKIFGVAISVGLLVCSIILLQAIPSILVLFAGIVAFLSVILFVYALTTILDMLHAILSSVDSATNTGDRVSFLEKRSALERQA